MEKSLLELAKENSHRGQRTYTRDVFSDEEKIELIYAFLNKEINTRGLATVFVSRGCKATTGNAITALAQMLLDLIRRGKIRISRA